VALRLNYPLSSWRAIFELADNTLSQVGLKHTLLCHSGSGVALINLLPNGNGDQDGPMIHAVTTLLAQCRKAGGNLVVERAPTDMKPALPLWGEPGPDLPLMKKLRLELDPEGLINPGRFCVGV
jgi:FAD/FMN-containing dehydrogenase